MSQQDDPQDALAPSPGTTTSSTGAGGEPSSPAPSTSDQPPTEAELRSFIESYLQTASSDPPAGFEQLTPAFQAASPDYAGFWGTVSNPRVLAFSADPEALTISYTYSFQKRGSGRQEDDETLQLVRSGDSFLIDGPPA